ncbi:MAG: hypothetical protein M3P53_01505 [Actinomycetota bacterium]|nr:hypothetical protein [Actinomycetota bacterium]
MAQLLVVLEARYLPEVSKPRIHLTNVKYEEWLGYREQFTPSAALGRFGWRPEELAQTADLLLYHARQRDPLKGQWSELVQRSSRRSWDALTGDVLVALDARIAAEILLLCYEDLAERSEAPMLSERPDGFHGQPRRLSQPGTSLDGNLSALGLSPHPGVVFVVEGETEELLLPRIQSRMRFCGAESLVRTVVMHGTTKDLTKLVSFAAAPLIERAQGDHWLVVKPPTQVFVSVDPDFPFDSAENIERWRTKMVNEIVAVIHAQGVDPDRDQLDSLVRVETWSQRCFEYAHFDDEELATALEAVHPDCNGLGHEELVRAVGHHRAHRQDIKQVWCNWTSKPSKKVLADELWPFLERKIAAAESTSGAAVPEVVLRLDHAYCEAANRQTGRWILRGSPVVR